MRNTLVTAKIPCKAFENVTKLKYLAKIVRNLRAT